jgi:hypothetical protein
MSKYADIAPRIWSGTASEAELRSFKPEDVLAIKSDVEHARVRAIARAKPKTIDREAGTVEWLASDETPDRMGDVILVKGWDWANWMRNPVILRNHAGDKLPLALGTDAYKRTRDGRPGFYIAGAFLPNEKLDEEGRLYRVLVLDGDLPASSVGFMPKKVSRPEDPKERAELGVGDFGVVYEAQELLEHSVVTVPANPNALLRKLDTLAESGAFGKALCAQVAKEMQPSTRTVHPVARTEGTGVRRADVPEANATITVHDHAGANLLTFETGGAVFDVTKEALSLLVRDAMRSTGGGVFTLGMGDVIGPDSATDNAVDSSPAVSLDATGVPDLASTLAEIKSALDGIKNTLSAELPALRAQLESVTRGAAALADPSGSHVEPTGSPAPDSRALKPEAVFDAAFAGLDAALAARKQKDKTK